MNVKDAFPSKYLKASDLGDAKVLVRIKRVEEEKVGRGQDIKPVVYFHSKEKGLVLNKTNGKKIAEIQGGSWDSDDWSDLEIGLFATETEFGDETVECIRVFDPKKSKKAAKPTPKTTEAELGIEDEPSDSDDSAF